MHHGSCLCGAVRLSIDAPLQDPIACHCQQCRRQSGHYFSAVAAPKSALTLQGADALTWYRASPVASRGFCGTCGATLVWRADDGPTIMVAMAALDAPTGMHLSAHYWVDHKGDYYTIADDLPQHEGETA
jgi:hypothetical protein